MNQSASAVVKRDTDPKSAYRDIAGLVEQRRNDIVASLVPGIDPEYFIAVGLQAVTRQPRLLECTPASIVKALRDASELGLMPGMAGMSYLVPYRNSSTRQYEAQLIVGYRGLIELALRSGKVQTIEGRVVRERDEFGFEYGTNQFIRHVPYVNLTNERGEDTLDERGDKVRGVVLDGGDYVAAYARAVMTSGIEYFDVMSMTEVNAIRSRSKARGGPWDTDTAEMIRKTPTRRMMKYLPMSTSVLTALDLDDVAEQHALPAAAPSTSPARKSLAASLGVSASPDGAPVIDTVRTMDADVDLTTDTPDTANAAQEAPTETSGCGAANDDGVVCGKQAGHDGPHRNASGDDDAVWPNTNGATK